MILCFFLCLFDASAAAVLLCSHFHCVRFLLLAVWGAAVLSMRWARSKRLQKKCITKRNKGPQTHHLSYGIFFLSFQRRLFFLSFALFALNVNCFTWPPIKRWNKCIYTFTRNNVMNNIVVYFKLYFGIKGDLFWHTKWNQVDSAWIYDYLYWLGVFHDLIIIF